ncbi:lipid A disaccharide synthase [Gammaproteobacteria bacterium]
MPTHCLVESCGVRIAFVAGEVSGDLLGAGLIDALRESLPEICCEGVIGPRMAAAGCVGVADIERLAVMGLIEVLGRLPELLQLRRRLVKHWRMQPPNVFVGIDAPDFTLSLERQLRARGIPTVHYVSPSVWAWRPWRVRKIARAADLVLTLFPFEVEFYARHGVDARFVGHPLADAIPLESDRVAARRALGLPEEGEIVALLPGSRRSELNFLATDFLAAAQWLVARRPGLRFVLPLAAAHLRPQLEQALTKTGQGLVLTILDGHAREALTAADVVLLASGTAALEALLVGRPMVVAYRLTPLSYRLIKPMMRVPYYSLPNHLIGRLVVPELIQEAVTPVALGQAILDYLEDPIRGAVLVEEFRTIHRQLRQGASRKAAEAIRELLEVRCHLQTGRNS